MFQNLPLQAAQNVRDSSSGVTPSIIMENDGVLYHQVSSSSPERWTKVGLQEPLRGIRYSSTRDEFIRALGRPIRNINKDGRTDGQQRLSNIWQKVINKVRL